MSLSQLWVRQLKIRVKYFIRYFYLSKNGTVILIFNFCIFIHLTIELNICHCSSKKRNTLLGLEDLEKVDVTFMISFFFFPQKKAQQFWDSTG